MTLEVSVSKRLGAFRIEAGFEAGPGITALFGRSGAGKTSLISMIAGLLRPDRGRIVADGRVLFDSAQAINIPAHKRRLGYVFQDGRLFPHLTVEQNLNYGRWFTAEKDRYVPVSRVIALLDLVGLLKRRPGALSGGEKQRVAIGRALIASPKILLMDEPLASLDERRKQDILPYVERLRDEVRIPIVYVSHALAEVARLATTVVLISDGRVEAAGATADILARVNLFPMTGRFEAGAVLDCVAAGRDGLTGLMRLRSRAGDLLVPQLKAEEGERLRVRVRARDVMIATERPQGLSARNVLAARVVELRSDPPYADVRLEAGGVALLARITNYSARELGLTVGREVYAVIKSTGLDRRSLGFAGGGSAGDGLAGGAEETQEEA